MMPLQKHTVISVFTIMLLSASSVFAQEVEGNFSDCRRPSAATEADVSARLMTGVFDNPAMKNALRDSSLSNIEVGYLGNRNVSEYAQDGDGWNGWNAGGDAFIRISGDMVAWGGASYEKGLRKNVYLAESSDYLEVMPMVVADTVFADKDREAYEFNAGFVWEGRRAGAGLQIDYSSACEYRTSDPRPKSDAVVARVRLGGIWRIADNHTLGLYGLLRKYSQDLDIDFYNEYNAATPLFQMQGVTSDYVRFSGSYSEAHYKGRLAGGGLTYGGPVNFRIGFSRRHLEKELPELQNAVINETFTNMERIDISRVLSDGFWNATFILSVSASQLEMTQNIYDDGTSNYHIIATRKPYTYDVRNADLIISAVKSSSYIPYGLDLRFHFGWSYSDESDADDASVLRKNQMLFELTPSVWNDWTLCRLTYGLSLRHRKAVGVKGDIGSPRLLSSECFYDVAARDFDRQTTPRTGATVNLRLDVDLPRHLRTVYIRASYASDWYASSAYQRSWQLVMAAGVTI